MNKTPLDFIKEGIQNNNMDCVVRGYAMLTGEDLEVGKHTGQNLKSKRGRKPKTEKPVTQVEIENRDITPTQSGDGHRLARRVPLVLHNFKNKFKDDGKTGVTSFDKKYKIKRVTIRRQPVKKVKVVCTGCGKSFEVYPKDLPTKLDKESGNYVCNRCVGRGVKL